VQTVISSITLHADGEKRFLRKTRSLSKADLMQLAMDMNHARFANLDYNFYLIQ
jgi:hypothetical protein